VEYEPPELIGFRYVESQNFLNLVKINPNTTNSNIVTPKHLRQKARGGPFKKCCSAVSMAIDPHRLLWAGSRAVRERIAVSGIPHHLNYRPIFIVHTQFRNVAAGPVIQTQRNTIHEQKLISWSSPLCLSVTERMVMCSKLQCLYLAMLCVWTLSQVAL
jgi:hypothetical protein